MLKKMALALIKAYQNHLSPRKGYGCALRLSGGSRSGCSGFGKRAIEREGLLTGLALLRRRLDKCAWAARARGQIAASAQPARAPGAFNSAPVKRPGALGHQGGFADCSGCDAPDCSGCDMPSCPDMPSCHLPEMPSCAEAPSCSSPQLSGCGRGAGGDALSCGLDALSYQSCYAGECSACDKSGSGAGATREQRRREKRAKKASESNPDNTAGFGKEDQDERF